MKRISILIYSFFALLTHSDCIQNKETQSRPLSLSTGELACKLTGPEFQKRKAELKERVFSQMISTRETDDGYIFQFPYDNDHLIILMDYVLAEKKCCPFFRHDLSIDANNDGVSWKVSGNAEVKKMIDLLVDEALAPD